MSKLNELLDLASQGKLDEIDTLAALAQKWSIIGDGVTISPFGLVDRPYWNSEDGSEGEYVDDYHPTRDKAQAWDLAEKAGIGINFIGDGTTEVTHDKLKNGLYLESAELAVTIAFILANQGEE